MKFIIKLKPVFEEILDAALLPCEIQWMQNQIRVDSTDVISFQISSVVCFWDFRWQSQTKNILVPISYDLLAPLLKTIFPLLSPENKEF